MHNVARDWYCLKWYTEHDTHLTKKLTAEAPAKKNTIPLTAKLTVSQKLWTSPESGHRRPQAAGDASDYATKQLLEMPVPWHLVDRVRSKPSHLKK